MKRVGRPPLAYDVKHVTINMKTEHYKRMRRDGSNMSRVINTFLDDLYGYSICPSCYQDDFEVHVCAKCEGRMLVCFNIACKRHGDGAAARVPKAPRALQPQGVPRMKK